MSAPTPSARHNDIMEQVPCNLCGHTETTLRFPDTRQDNHLEGSWSAFCCTHPGYGVHPPIVQCAHCGLVYTNPRPRRDAILHNYEEVVDPLYLQERHARELTFQRHLRKFEAFTGPAAGRRLLDVGAYIGVFVEEANRTGWRATGIEPSTWAVEYARERGLDVVRGVLDDDLFEPASFDAITMWDVFEHLGDPMNELQRMYDLLRPGGWIAVHTMDIGSLFARMMGRRWPWLMEMHIYYFTSRTLAEIIRKAGFEVRTVRPEGRYLRLKYLTTRLRPYSTLLAGIVDDGARLTGLDRLAIPLNMGDLVTAYARKPEA
ncbi:MAG: class I SAM-dependent methyltransferase [Anaerolineae bacterium]|nr:class I SAM-dependent methyltransferase [Anaerolineae bacterium]